MKIRPRRQYDAEVTVPGDKSITHRAVMFNAIAEGEAVVSNALLGADCLSTVSCMCALGAEAAVEGDVIRVKGAPLHDAACDCGNSGTTMRLLMGLVAGQKIGAVLTGDASLSKRPMGRVAKPLRILGADIETQDGTAPVTVRAAKLVGREVDTASPSAQVKSALLLAGLGADGETFVHESVKTRDHTERMLAAMGADIRVIGNMVRVKKSRLKSTDVEVPGDISSAAYFLALGALLGETLCKNVGVNPTRTGILRAFDQMGVCYSLENERIVCGEPVADIRVRKSPLRAIHLTKEIMPSLIDELPVIAVLCAYAEGESVISGAEELKIKESDRIKTTAEMISGLGGDIIPRQDGFVIRGRKILPGGTANSYADHRIAMSAAVALAASENGGEIKNAGCVDISFPGFFRMLGE